LCAFAFNLSFYTGIVPDSLKIAKVFSVYKKVERNLPGNYLPISLLSIFDKNVRKINVYMSIWFSGTKQNFVRISVWISEKPFNCPFCHGSTR